MLTNCFRFAPRDSVPGLIAKICKYLKEHPGWSEEELEEQIKQFIGQTGVESFNGRTGAVALNENDVNNLKIASAYFAEGDETINELDLVTLYNQGVRFVFTNWNSVTSGYDLAFVLEYFSGYNDVVYYPMANGSGGGNIISVNGKTGIVELNLSDILGDSGAQVKLCTALEFTSNTLATWNAYYASGYRFVCVVNDESTAVDFLYVLKQDTNNHQPIMISSTSGESAVTSVNTMVGDVIIPVVDVSNGNSQNQFAKIFVVENEDYPIVPSDDSYKLGGELPSYYAKAEDVHQLSEQKADKAGWTPNKLIGTDENGNLVAQDPPEDDGGDADTLDGKHASDFLLKTEGLQMELLWQNDSPTSVFGNRTIERDLKEYEFILIAASDANVSDLRVHELCRVGSSCVLTETTYYESDTYFWSRYTHASEAGVTFQGAFGGVTSRAGSAADDRVVPVEIYGVKGLKLVEEVS